MSSWSLSFTSHSYKGSSFLQPFLALMMQSPTTPHNSGLNKALTKAALRTTVQACLHESLEG